MTTVETKISIADDTIRKLIDALVELKPLLNGSSGMHLGIYQGAAKNICDMMGWQIKTP